MLYRGSANKYLLSEGEYYRCGFRTIFFAGLDIADNIQLGFNFSIFNLLVICVDLLGLLTIILKQVEGF